MAAMILPGDYVTPERLMECKERDALCADKDRWVFDNKAVLGEMGDKLHDYYLSLVKKPEAEQRAEGNA
ncbi:MAG: hypothetical protein KJN60_11280 [Boseongicola sp.]|nr:hypothetical protein [Boseongicola sp.]